MLIRSWHHSLANQQRASGSENYDEGQSPGARDKPYKKTFKKYAGRLLIALTRARIPIHLYLVTVNPYPGIPVIQEVIKKEFAKATADLGLQSK